MSLLLASFALLVVPSHPPARARLHRLFRLGETATPAPRSVWFLSAVAGGAVALLTASVIGGTQGLVPAVLAGAGATLGFRRLLRATSEPELDPLRLAGGWDLLAACLRSGLPVPVAVRAIADHLPREVAAELRVIADRLALGADPRTAWEVRETSPVHKLARAARRSAHSGAGLAGVAVSIAAEVRASAQDLASARGQRAGVLITGPLGLCFLPAFLALGVVPVVIGLASGLAVTW
ncbi:type II secretion system F family protein [Pseudonocardia spinosispora]|uniref:type II secretion system F family protein n=1 Tax=Pseudonocardia spinosispora TaxID=103441 RepID=UPI000A02BF21|nr:type II secretion system F family protein [Pseudonocardia spinosispora]